MNTEEEIIEKLKEILKDRFGLQKELEEDAKDALLTGPCFGFNAARLYQFLMCVEEEFHIYLKPEEIIQNGFRTLSEAARLIGGRLAGSG